MAEYFEKVYIDKARRMNADNSPISLLSTTDRIMNAFETDTLVGQAAMSLKFHTSADGDFSDFTPIENYNPIRDENNIGYENHLNDILHSRSPNETLVIKQIIDRNNSNRRSFEDHGWSRFFGNLLDPINLVPIPIARGLGFVRGSIQGSKAGAVGIGASEIIRAELDPTNPVEEPYIAIAGGALLGGAIGGIAGGIKGAKLDFLADNWFMSQDVVDAHNIIDPLIKDIGAIKSYVEPLKGERMDDHLSRLIGKTEQQSQLEYDTMIFALGADKKSYDAVVTYSKSYQPDALVPTNTGIEGLRWTQHPYLFMKNNLFEGDLGNMIRQAADRIVASPGMMTRQQLTGRPTARGVHNKAKLHNKEAVDVSTTMYNSYLKEQGIDPTTMTPFNRAVKSIQTGIFQGREYKAFKEEVAEMYITGIKSEKEGVVEAANGIKKYMEYMGLKGSEASLFGKARINKRIQFLEENSIPQADLSVARQAEYMAGKGTADNHLVGINWLRKSINDLESKRTLSRKQSENLEKFRQEAEDIEFLLRGFSSPEQRLAFINKPTSEISNKSIQIYQDRLRKRQTLIDEIELSNNQLKYFDEQTAQGIGPKAEGVKQFGHWSRMWKHDEITAHRDAFVKLLDDWYVTTNTTGARANRTVASIMGERTKFDIKASLDNAMIEQKMSASARGSALEKIDEIFAKANTEAENLVIAQDFLKDFVKKNHIGTDGQFKNLLDEIDQLASRGEPDGLNFGASTAARERLVDIPNKLLLKKNNGIADFIETDPEIMIRRYHRRMSASIEMSNEFGDATMKGFMEDMKFRMDEKIHNASTAKEAEELTAEAEKVTQAMFDLKEKVLGVYKMPVDPSSVGQRSVRGLKNAMVLALMGKASVAALADIGRTVMSVGLRRSMGGTFDRFTIATEEFKVAGKEVEQAGEAAEIALHGRWEAFFDVDGSFGSNTMVERLLDAGVNKMFILNALSPYTDMMKRFSGAMIQSEMIRTSVKWANNLKYIDEYTGQGIANRFNIEVKIGPIDPKVRKPRAIKRMDPETGEEVLAPAFFNGKTNTLYIDDEAILASFDRKPWLNPKMEGVKPLEYDFANPQEWLDFNIRHELSHTRNKIKKGESRADYENRTNDIALTQMRKDPLGEWVMRGDEGVLTTAERNALTKVGIGLNEAVRIAEQWKNAGSTKGNSLWLANTQNWKGDDEIKQIFRVGLVDEINNAVVTPGPAEKLNFMSTPVGSLMTQFKSFGLSATHRTLLAGLQQRDAKAFHGIISMIGMGYIVDLIKSPSYDKRDFVSIDRLVQAIEYSGTTGIMFDLNNMIEVTSGNKLGIRPSLGVDSFFQNPNLAQRTGQVGGPIASLGGDLFNSLLNPDADSQDMARSLRRLLPFNNLVWFSWAVDRLQRSAGSIGDDDDNE